MEELSFQNVDDIADAALQGNLRAADLPRLSVGAFGPMIELLQLRRQYSRLHDIGTRWINMNGTADFWNQLTNGTDLWRTRTGRKAGFTRVNHAKGNLSDWTGFTMAAKRAAVSSGLTSELAGQVVSAFDELLDNVVEHSGAPRTGVAAYCSGDGKFEISISDVGMGVLASLKRSSEFVHLEDHGEALQLFIQDGISRFGADKGRGFGFRPLFTGLANAQCEIRFRSGDYALQIDGTKLCEAPAFLVQTVDIQGLACSIVCHHKVYG